MINIADLNSIHPKRSISRFVKSRWSIIFILCIFWACLLCFGGVFRTRWTVLDKATWENSQRLNNVIYFSKELDLTFLNGYQENSHPENTNHKTPPGKSPPWIFPPMFLNIPTWIFLLLLLFFHYCHHHHRYYLKDCLVILCFKSAAVNVLKKFRSQCIKKIVACRSKFDNRSLL